ncbi:TPA: hypothetical protein VW502_001034 [Streptococcus pneumoniae]|nr:hypothetical protein [Streptococcus pneumoniae]
MNEIFNFHGQEVRTLTIDDEPWFVGKDVADILGYANSRKAIFDHVDDDDKTDGVTIRDAMGRNQNPIIILPKKHADAALAYWMTWEPSTNTKMKIMKLNSFDEV